MRLKNFIINVESASPGNASGDVKNGVVEVPDNIDVTFKAKGPGFSMISFISGSNESLADYSHFNAATLRSPNSTTVGQLIFSGTLSGTTENSKDIEGSVLVITEIE